MFKAYRLLTQFIGFSNFVIGSIIYGSIVYGVIILFTREPLKREQRLRSIVRSTFAFFIKLCGFLSCFKVKVKNLEALHQSKNVVIIANHPSLVDYVIIASLMNLDVTVMVKETLTNGFMKMIIKHLGYFHNKTPIEDMEKILKQNNGVLIFPEGTRTKDYSNIHFVRGAANIALRKELDILPIFINSTQRSYLASSFFNFNIPKDVPIFNIEVGEAIKVKEYAENYSTLAIAARHLTKDLEKLYQDYLNK